MKAVILAGGYGIRLRPITVLIPKPLLGIGDKSLLEIIIGKLKKYGIKNFVLATGYKSDLIETYFKNGDAWKVSIKYLRETKPLGTAGIISYLPKDEGDFILMNGDIVTNLNFTKFIKFHKKNKFDITVAYRKIKEKSPYGAIQLDGDNLASIVEKPVINYNASAGIYIINKAAARLVKKNKFYTMPELIMDAIKNGMSVGAYEIKEYWLGVEHLAHFEQAYLNKEKWH